MAAMLEFLISFVSVLFYVMLGAGWVILMFQMMLKRLYPIPVVVLRNTGGDDKTPSLHPKIVLRGKIKRTELGDVVRVWGLKQSLPLSLFSRDYAHPFGASSAFFALEKEHGQFFPVRFAGNKGELKAFPLDAITPYTYNVKARNLRVRTQSNWEKIMPFAGLALIVVAFIVGLVLFLEWTADRMDAVAGNVRAASDTFADQIADRMAGDAPGGSGMFLPPIFWRRKQGVAS